MKSSTKKLLVIEVCLFLFFLLNIFWFNISSLYTLSFILLLFIGVIKYFLGYEKSNKRFKKDIMLNFVIYTIIFQIFFYLLGILFGYLNSGYSMSITNIIRNTLPNVLIITVFEILRYCINIKGQNSKLIIVFSLIIFVIIDVSLQSYLFDFINKKEIIELFCTTVFQSVSRNILLTYSSIKFGYQGNLIYRFIMELPIYFIPIIPNIDIYLESILQLLFPVLVFNRVYRNLNINGLKKNDFQSKSYIGKIVTLLITIVCLCIVGLTSRVFSFFALSIGSDSMFPNVNKGDVIIVKR